VESAVIVARAPLRSVASGFSLSPLTLSAAAAPKAAERETGAERPAVTLDSQHGDRVSRGSSRVGPGCRDGRESAAFFTRPSPGERGDNRFHERTPWRAFPQTPAPRAAQRPSVACDGPVAEDERDGCASPRDRGARFSAGGRRLIPGIRGCGPRLEGWMKLDEKDCAQGPEGMVQSNDRPVSQRRRPRAEHRASGPVRSLRCCPWVSAAWYAARRIEQVAHECSRMTRLAESVVDLVVALARRAGVPKLAAHAPPMLVRPTGLQNHPLLWCFSRPLGDLREATGRPSALQDVGQMHPGV